MTEVWQELRENREAGARRLIAEYGDRLYAAALFICPSPADAEDLVFRTFERAIDRIAQFVPKGDFFSWLYTIMLNFRRMELRKGCPDVISMGTAMDLPEVVDDSLADALSSLDAEQLREAVRKLPLLFAEVLVLRFFEERSLDEIALVLGIPVGTVKSRLHNAKVALRKELGGWR